MVFDLIKSAEIQYRQTAGFVGMNLQKRLPLRLFDLGRQYDTRRFAAQVAEIGLDKLSLSVHSSPYYLENYDLDTYDLLSIPQSGGMAQRFARMGIRSFELQDASRFGRVFDTISRYDPFRAQRILGRQDILLHLEDAGIPEGAMPFSFRDFSRESELFARPLMRTLIQNVRLAGEFPLPPGGAIIDGGVLVRYMEARREDTLYLLSHLVRNIAPAFLRDLIDYRNIMAIGAGFDREEYDLMAGFLTSNKNPHVSDSAVLKIYPALERLSKLNPALADLYWTALPLYKRQALFNASDKEYLLEKLDAVITSVNVRHPDFYGPFLEDLAYPEE